MTVKKFKEHKLVCFQVATEILLKAIVLSNIIQSSLINKHYYMVCSFLETTNEVRAVEK